MQWHAYEMGAGWRPVAAAANIIALDGVQAVLPEGVIPDRIGGIAGE